MTIAENDRRARTVAMVAQYRQDVANTHRRRDASKADKLETLRRKAIRSFKLGGK